MEIYRDIAQGTPEWNALRLASIGGSTITHAVAKGDGKTREALMWDWVEEKLSGVKKDSFVSWDMKEGIKWEPRGRLLYEIRTGIEVDQVALVKHSEFKHYSPDGFPDPRGLLEIKRAKLPVFLDAVKTRNIPTARRRQVQWGMSICKRDWCDYVMYCPYIEKSVDPLLVIRVGRDEKEIKELHEGADQFIEDFKGLYLRSIKTLKEGI